MIKKKCLNETNENFKLYMTLLHNHNTKKKKNLNYHNRQYEFKINIILYMIQFNKIINSNNTYTLWNLMMITMVL